LIVIGLRILLFWILGITQTHNNATKSDAEEQRSALGVRVYGRRYLSIFSRWGIWDEWFHAKFFAMRDCNPPFITWVLSRELGRIKNCLGGMPPTAVCGLTLL
jgi:hypothetical protein